MYDAIVIGGRCSGSTTAMLLAQRGHRVLLVERNTFPSDAISTMWIWPTGVACLKRWNLWNRLRETGCPPWGECIVDLQDYRFSGRLPALEGTHEMIAPRRKILDKILIDAAIEAGVEVREQFTVTGLTGTNGRVTGIRGHVRGGEEIEIAARLVIGADGKHSFVAKTVGAEMYKIRPTLTCWYYVIWSGIKERTPGSHPRGRTAIVTAPTNEGNFITGVCFHADDFPKVRLDPEGHILTALEQVPDLAAQCRDGARVERVMGTGDLPNFFRKPYGDGWALVGDAGYTKDPIGAQGISDAFVSTQMLVDALDTVSAGKRTMNEAMADFHKRRDQHFAPMYELNSSHARMEPLHPQMRPLFEALQYDDAEKQRFLGTVAGTASIPEFYAPANIQRIIRNAGVKKAASAMSFGSRPTQAFANF